MLDVHMPHGKMESFKDFALHLFTITVGLLIALGLEGCVERYHKSEIRREAEANLRQELLDNQKIMRNWEPMIKDEARNMQMVLDFIEARKAGKPYDISKIGLGYSISSLDDASWRTATATGALSLMDYNEVQRYAGVYQAQDRIMTIENEALEDFMQVQGYAKYLDPQKATVADLERGEPDAGRALAHILTLQELGAEMEKVYEDVLRGK